jgi:hypothetical protein
MQRTIVITAQNMPQSEQRSRMKPELNVKKKVEALERRRAMLHALIAFVQAHPRIASKLTLGLLAKLCCMASRGTLVCSSMNMRLLSRGGRTESQSCGW